MTPPITENRPVRQATIGGLPLDTRVAVHCFTCHGVTCMRIVHTGNCSPVHVGCAVCGNLSAVGYCALVRVLLYPHEITTDGSVPA